VVASVPTVVGDDLAACADPVRGYAALYVGGMGSREKNFYNALAVRMGYAEEAAEIQDLFLARKHREAMAAVPQQFIESISLLGSTRADRRQADRLRRRRGDHARRHPVRGDRRGAHQHAPHGRGGPRARRDR
jgi:hypothetical protein